MRHQHPAKCVGLVGLGLMGTALAERFLAARYEVRGHDVNPARCRALKRMGVVPAESATALASTCDRLVFSLPHTGVVLQVIDSMKSVWRRGALVVDTTTGDPRAVPRLASALRRRGVRYLDATIVGSSAEVRSGRAVLAIGGARPVVVAARGLLDAISPRRFHAGPAGAGSRLKLVVNLVLGLNRAALAEGLSFARRIGVDPYLALDVLRAGAAYSRVMDLKGMRMLRGDFKPVAKLSQHLKDVRLILALSRGHGGKLPLSQQHRRLLLAAERAGFGEFDNCAIIKAFE